MKIWKSAKAGFTLVELLVVIAIISIVAMAMFSAVKGARRQAHAAKCQANMKNLHTAVVAYFADKQHYPAASSYECYKKYYDGGKREEWWEIQGWVSWLPKSASTPRRKEVKGKKQTPWQERNDRSYADDFVYISNTDERMRDAISEGALYKYAGKNHETYKCPDNTSAHLAYAMNNWFHCHYSRSWTLRKIGTMGDIEPSKIVLFVEIAGQNDVGSGLTQDASKGNYEGQDGSKKIELRLLGDDACWDWREKISVNGEEHAGTPETGRFTHRKAGHMYTHVVFLDGHVASISDDYKDFNTEHNPTKKASKLSDVFVTLGEGSY